jgi:hypothetical protein
MENVFACRVFDKQQHRTCLPTAVWRDDGAEGGAIEMSGDAELPSATDDDDSNVQRFCGRLTMRPEVGHRYALLERDGGDLYLFFWKNKG